MKKQNLGKGAWIKWFMEYFYFKFHIKKLSLIPNELNIQTNKMWNVVKNTITNATRIKVICIIIQLLASK